MDERDLLLRLLLVRETLSGSYVAMLLREASAICQPPDGGFECPVCCTRQEILVEYTYEATF
jgi:hypothetical protein